MNALFSTHAFDRVSERISLSHEELALILDYRLVVNIGMEPGSNRAHFLFYSILDKQCFVAIQDVKSGVVVSVLPIDYHNNCAWIVTSEAQLQAISMLGPERGGLNKGNTILVGMNKKPLVFKVSGLILDKFMQLVKIVNLGSTPCTPYRAVVRNLIQSDSFLEDLRNRIKNKNIDKSIGSIGGIRIQVGKKGKPVSFLTDELFGDNAVY